MGSCQCKVGPRESGRKPWKHMHAKRRRHGQPDDGQIEKHDDGLTPTVLAITLCARKPRASQKACPHCDFQQQNDVGCERGLRSQEISAQGFIPVETRTNFYPSPLTPLRNPPRCPVIATSTAVSASSGRQKRRSFSFCARLALQ